MKVLIVNDYGTLGGGAERVSLILRDELRARGHDARLFASSARPLGLENQADDVCFGSESPLRRILGTANPSAVLGLSRALRDFRPDVVHVRMFLTQLSPLILPLLRDVPCLLHVVNYQTVCPLNTKILPDGSRCRVLAGKACYDNGCVSLAGLARTICQLGLWRRWRDVFDMIVANSAWLGERLRADGVAVDRVILNGTTLRAPRSALGDPPTVGFAGRLVPKKGVDILVRAMALVVGQVPAARLLIAGDGPERATLTRLVAELGLGSRVSMTGHLASPELDHQLGTAWAQAVPSTYEEPFPNVAVEAMMRGTAVVATSVGGSTEIVREGRTGYLVPPGDPAALANALVKVLRNQAGAEAMGAAGRAVALEEFQQSRMVEQFLEVYAGLSRIGDPTPGA
jgi:glycosyltransferase involved in cell wall biosynthesis